MRVIPYAFLACLIIFPASAQQATGVGVAKSSSTSQAGAVAISGQGGSANGNGNSAVTINATPATQTINSVASGTQTLKNVPTVFAPSLAAAGLETCLGSVSGGGAFVGTGFSFGTTIPDPGCAARLDARTLWSMGLRKAAVIRLCLMPDIYRSMAEVCAQYMPQQVAQVTAVTYTGGPVEVVMQKTGEHKMCADYDVTRHRCRVWAR